MISHAHAVDLNAAPYDQQAVAQQPIVSQPRHVITSFHMETIRQWSHHLVGCWSSGVDLAASLRNLRFGNVCGYHVSSERVRTKG